MAIPNFFADHSAAQLLHSPFSLAGTKRRLLVMSLKVVYDCRLIFRMLGFCRLGRLEGELQKNNLYYCFKAACSRASLFSPAHC